MPSTDFKSLFETGNKSVDLSSRRIMVSSLRYLLYFKLTCPTSHTDVFNSFKVSAFLHTRVQISWEGIPSGKNDLMSLLLSS